MASNARSLTRYSFSDACAVRRDRGCVPDGGEPLDEIAGRHDVDARAAGPARSCRRRRAQMYGIAHRANTPSRRAARRVSSRAARLRAARGRRSARSCRAGARARRVRWRARARAARRWPESGSTSAASRDGRPARPTPVTSAAIGLSAAEIVEQPAVEAVGGAAPPERRRRRSSGRRSAWRHPPSIDVRRGQYSRRHGYHHGQPGRRDLTA